MFAMCFLPRSAVLIMAAFWLMLWLVEGTDQGSDINEKEGSVNKWKVSGNSEQWRPSELRLKKEVKRLQRMLVAKDHMLKEAQKEVAGIRQAFNDAKHTMKSLKRSLDLEKRKEVKLQRSYEKEHVKYGKTSERLKELENKLDEAIERAENPKITKWLTRRAEDVGLFLDSPRTGQILGESVSSMLSSSSNTLHSLESSLETNLSSMVADSPYSEVAAVVFSYILILMPVVFVIYVMKRLTKSISVRQYILLGHLFNIGLVFTCFLLSIIFGEDPFSSLRKVSNRTGVILMVFFALQCPVFLFLTIWASLTGNRMKEKVYFAVQAFLYTLVAYNYRVRVWKPVMAGDTSSGIVSVYGYSVYMVAIGLMIYFTVAAAKARRDESLVADIEKLVSDSIKEMNGQNREALYQSVGKIE